MIKLYEGINITGPSATFTSDPYPLIDAISCTVTEERNGQFSLVMQYPIGAQYWEKIIPDAIIMVQPRPNADAEPFRICDINQVIDGIITARANHLVYDLDGLYIGSPANAFSGKQGITAVLNQLNTSGQFGMRCFDLANDGITDTTTELDFGNTKYCSIWKCIGIVAAAFNAELKYTWDAYANRCTITFCAARGTAKNTIIEYGVNISRLDRKLDYNGLYSRVVAVWFANDGTFYQGYADTGYTGRVRSLWIDVTDQFPPTPTFDQLNAWAQAYVDSHDFSPLSDLSVEFVPLENTTENTTPPVVPSLSDSVPYAYRASGGVLDLGIRNREEDKLIGGTIAWNQLASLIASDWYTYRATVASSDNTLSVTTTSSSSTKYAQFSLVTNHKYLVTGTLHASASGTLAIGIYSGTTTNTYSYREICNASDSLAVAFIAENTYATGNLRIQHATGVSSGAVGSVDNLQVFDLTAMFGSAIADYIYSLESGTVGDGIAWFKNLFPESYYAYKSVQLMSVNASAHVMRDAGTHIIGNYALDSDLELRGILKLDASNKLYYDGDEYESNGTVTRKYEYRSYAGGDESLADAITDGTHTVVKLVTPTTETADPYANPQVVDADGTEQYVDAAYEAGTRDFSMPVGHETKYTFIPEDTALKLCDTATVDASIIGVTATAKCVKCVYNVNTGMYDSVTVGTIQSDIVDTILKLEG